MSEYSTQEKVSFGGKKVKYWVRPMKRESPRSRSTGERNSGVERRCPPILRQENVTGLAKNGTAVKRERRKQEGMHCQGKRRRHFKSDRFGERQIYDLGSIPQSCGDRDGFEARPCDTC